MNPVSELLAGLRDIHLPAAVSWWPPAPLWWWSLAVAAALSVEPVSGELHRRHRVSAQGYYRGRKVVQTAGKADTGGGEEQGG